MVDRIMFLGITLLTFSLRVWQLDTKGLAYDEAATALMARATPWEILQFHWNASFEHPPLWQLLMHGWSHWAGQSEWALRFLPVGAGVVMVPLVGQLAWRAMAVSARVANRPASHWPALLPGLSSLLAAFSPLLVLYSQEARMYTLVSALALAALYLTHQVAHQPRWRWLISLVLVHWAMLGFHYYSALLIGAEALYLAWVAWWTSRHWLRFGISLVLSLLPLLAWISLAPGFRITAAIVLQNSGEEQPSILAFLTQLWRDLSFGAIRWQPEQAQWGYGLLPLLLIGVGGLLVDLRRGWPASNRNLLLLGVLVFPVLFSALLFPTLATRYILFVLPVIYLLIAVGIDKLWHFHWGAGLVGLALPMVIAGAGLSHYFGSYQKSEYKAMAAYLTARLQPEDGVLLEAPRQHLLAKYYLPPGPNFYTAPAVLLPAYWPISAPPVVPEELDGQIQRYLRQHPTLWLILTAQDEVDKGEFVPKYLQAVSFKTACQSWLDVILCRFVSPHFAATPVQTQPAARWNAELDLSQTALGLDDPQSHILVLLQWQAVSQPTLDYRVTLRLLDEADNVISQQDEFPIGNLLPPTTWATGDEKPGYMALPVPTKLAPGRYRMVVGIYDPASVTLLPYTGLKGDPMNPLITIAQVEMTDSLTLHPPVRP